MEPLTDDARRAILDEIAEYATVPPRKDGDVTAADVALEFGLTQEGARYHLNKMTAEGKLIAVLVRDEASGRRVRVWRKHGADQPGHE